MNYKISKLDARVGDLDFDLERLLPLLVVGNRHSLVKVSEEMKGKGSTCFTLPYEPPGTVLDESSLIFSFMYFRTATWKDSPASSDGVLL